jgi:predicted ATPase
LPAETIATRESYLQATALIGRDEELNRLLAALELVREGEGSSFLVGGESGIGKSRLLSELRTQALVRGMWAVEGQSVTNGGAYYQEWIPLLRALCFRADISDAEASVLKPLLPDIGDVLGRPIPDSEIPKTDDMPERFAATLAGLLARVRKPVLIIQEDLHWARSETLALLASIAARARGLPLLLVGTFRSDESPRLAEALPSMEVIALRRLSTQGIARLSASMLGTVGGAAGLVSYLEQQTDGNVFFLVEVVRALAERAGDLRAIAEGMLPETVLTLGIERIIERRLGRVPSSLGPLLELSATLGRKLDVVMLERAFPDIDLRNALIECANAAILESQGADWRFAHDKLREAILRRIEPDRRRSLHQKLAESLEAVYEPAAREAMGATLAFHFEKAGAFEKAVAYYLLAEKDAQRRNLPVERRAHCAAAIATMKALPDTPERRRLHTDILIKQVAAGLGYVAIQAMLEYIIEARALMETLINTEAAVPADRLRMARLDHLQGRIYQYSSQSREAILYYERVLENTKAAEAAEAAELKVMTLSRIGLSLCYQGQFGRARRLLEGPSRRILEERGVHSDSMRCAMYYSLALAGSGYSREALAWTEEASKLTNRLNLRDSLIVFQSLQFLVLITMADWPRVREHAIESIELTRQTNEPMAEMPALDALAWAQGHLGDTANAVLNRERVAAARRTVRGGFLPDWFEAAEAEILLNAGRIEDALRHAQEVAAASRAAEQLFSLAIAERTTGVALGRLGEDRAKAEAHFEESIAISRSAEQVMNEAQGELCWGQLLRERGDERSAQAHFTRAIARMEAGGFSYALDRARAIAAGTE